MSDRDWSFVLKTPVTEQKPLTVVELTKQMDELNIDHEEVPLDTVEDVHKFIGSNKLTWLTELRELIGHCLESASIDYDKKGLQDLTSRNDCWELLTAVFKLEGEASASSERSESSSKWAEVLPNVSLDDKVLLAFDKIKNFMSNLKNASGALHSDDELRAVLAGESMGVKVRQFVRDCLEEYSIKYDEDELDGLDKQQCMELFFDVFSFTPIASPTVKEPITADGDQSVGTSSESTVETPTVGDQTVGSQSVDGKTDGNELNEPSRVESESVVTSLSAETLEGIYANGQRTELTTEQIDHDEWEFINGISLPSYKGVKIYLSEPSLSVHRGLVALINLASKEVCAIGHLEGAERTPTLVFNARDISFDKMMNGSALYDLILFPSRVAGVLASGSLDATQLPYYALECTVECRELEETIRPLCIDFGTSNTTAGSYGINDAGIEIVPFFDCNDGSMKQMFPTLVYVESCEDKDNIKYRFGYEAQQLIVRNHYEPKATVFHEIKCWFDDLDRTEDIYDENKFKAHVARESIVKAYISHVLSLAQEHFGVKFKQLHFTAPIKLKKFFIDKFKRMFDPDGYSVLRAESSLDEGAAIVYNYIMRRLEVDESSEREPLAAGEKETVLILDCGGGTSDLARCCYSYTDAFGDAKKLQIETGFENGDPSFGGNNITYRILQLLKIKIVAGLEGESLDIMQEIMNKSENEIMTALDESFDNKRELYRKFTEAYDRADEKIPTRFEDKGLRTGDKSKIQRNYYYLWQMAESLKIEFYKSSNTVSIDFNRDTDKQLFISGAENYFLYVRKGTNLQRQTDPLRGISVTIKEINRVICPDLYSLLLTMLDEYSNERDSDQLGVTLFYKLSGQSCRISLFHDLLKEFIPGRFLRRGNDDKTQDDQLKMNCLKGAISYLMEKEYGNVIPDMRATTSAMVYDVSEDRGKQPPLRMLSRAQTALITKANSSRLIKIVVRDQNRQLKNEIEYPFSGNKPELYQSIRLSDLINAVKQKADVTPEWEARLKDKIIYGLSSIDLARHGGGMQYFVFLMPARDGYGFLIYQGFVRLESERNVFYWRKENGHFVGYERMASFFDGKR